MATRTTRRPALPDARRKRARWPVAALSALSAFVACELGLRALLFSSAFDGTEAARRLRVPEAFAPLNTDQVYWTLRWAFGQGVARDRPPESDPLLGWRGRSLIRPGTYAHQDEARLMNRRPVALFGDSYAACTTERQHCFEGLLARSDRDAELWLLNYGVGGFGFDQVVLLMESVLERWDGLPLGPGAPKPIVVVSVFVDDDLDRCAVGLRDWPKPRFHLEGGELVLEPPATLSNREWVERNGIGVGSYLWRYLLHGADVLPAPVVSRLGGKRSHDLAMRPLSRALVERAVRALDERGVEAFFLLFPGLLTLEADGGIGWQVPHLGQVCESLGARFVDARYDFHAHMRETGMTPIEYFGTEGPHLGHYTALGNEIAFRALLRGLDGETDAGRGEP